MEVEVEVEVLSVEKFLGLVSLALFVWLGAEVVAAVRAAQSEAGRLVAISPGVA